MFFVFSMSREAPDNHDGSHYLNSDCIDILLRSGTEYFPGLVGSEHGRKMSAMD